MNDADQLLIEIKELREENQRLKEKMNYRKNETLSDKFRRKYAKQIFESLPDMCSISDYDGNLAGLISGEKTNHTGAPLDVLFNKNISDIIEPDSAAGLLKSLKRAKEEKKLSFGHHSILLNETRYHYEHRVIPMDDEYALIISRDITLAQERDKQILELSYFYNSILNAVPAYIFAKDVEDDFKYIFWNKAFSSGFNKTLEKHTEYTDFDIFDDNIAKAFREQDLLSASQETKIITEEYCPANKDTYLATQKTITASPSGRKILIGISQDITNLKKAKKELKEAKIKAEENDRKKSEFLSNMGHEIKTPINAICGFSELLSKTDDPKEQNEYVDIIRTNSMLLSQLINDILDISRIEAGVLEFSDKNIDLGDICHKLYEIHSKQTNKYVKLIYKNEGETMPLFGDPNRIMQVINNFLTNACKFTLEGSITMGFTDMGEQVKIYITDTGMGISEERLKTIFERFVKLNSKIQGTGLGLAICHMIVEKMGGTIGATSKIEEGSTFYCIIPKKSELKI